MNRRAKAAGLVGGGAIVAAAVVGPCTPPGSPRQACLDPARSTVVATVADESTRWPHADQQTPGRTFDARGRTWALPGTTNVVKFYRARTGTDACLVGGTFTTTLPPDTPWETWHENTALVSQQTGTRVEGSTFAQVGDAMSFYHDAVDWEVRDVTVDMAYDDCIENDGMNSGVISGSVFSCGSAFVSATTPNAERDGTGETVVIEDVMVQMVPFRNSYNVDRWGHDQHGGFFKWADRLSPPGSWGIPPLLVVRDSMFRSDTPAAWGAEVAGGPNGLPAGTVCERVTLVGDGWDAAEMASWVSQCDDLTIGTEADWDREKAQR